MSRLYLVDGMSHLYRAYYAIQGLTNREGKPTNAVYGFITMLRKLLDEERPEYLAVAIDVSKKTVRHEQFEDYKAHRKPMPEDLVEQLPYLQQVCDVFRVPLVSLERYEADDVIGTLARQAAEQELEVVIVTIDKDMYQLVDDKVSVLDTRTMTRYDSAGVEEKLGVRPDQVVDILSLIGDSSDNIPGAPGIGKKGAQSLIAEYGSLDALLKERDHVKRKSYRESLQNNEEQILQSRELLRIQKDLPVELDLDEFSVSGPDAEKARDLFTELNFTSLMEEFLPAEPAGDPDYQETKTAAEFRALRKALAGKSVALDLTFESGDYIHGQPVAVAISPDPFVAWSLSSLLRADALGLFPELFETVREVVTHDAKKLAVLVQRNDWRMPDRFRDTMLGAYLLNPNQKDFSLSQLALEYLQYRFQEESGQESLFGDEKWSEVCERADVTFRLHERLFRGLEDKSLEKLLETIELPLVEVLAAMEIRGVRVDPDFLKQMSRELSQEIESLQSGIFRDCGVEFNLNSPKQLAEVLFEKLNLPGGRKKGKAGHYSTSVEVLEALANDYDVVGRILEYRELTKLKNTYLDALPRLIHPESGRIHTTYHQMVASTGRLSSSNPNLQNIPIRTEVGRRIRRAFVPADGFKLMTADYSQIELRVMAHLSGDRVLGEAFRQGEDIHERTAREVFGEGSGLSASERRRRAKVINFGIMYGLSAFGLARSLKIDRSEAQQFIDDYFERYQGVRAWIEKTIKSAERKGVVTTLFGRIRPIPEIGSKNWNLREFARRTAVNAPIQGTAADLIKIAMVSIFRRMKEKNCQSKLIMQVHDELVFEVEQSEVDAMKALVVEEMEGVAELDVPLKVDLGVGTSWLDAK